MPAPPPTAAHDAFVAVSFIATPFFIFIASRLPAAFGQRRAKIAIALAALSIFAIVVDAAGPPMLRYRRLLLRIFTISARF